MMAGNRLAASKPGTTHASNPTACAAVCGGKHRGGDTTQHARAAGTAHVTRQLRVHWVGVACEVRKRSHVFCSEDAPLLKDGARHELNSTAVALR